MKFSADEIRELLAEGWISRRKRVKNHEYVYLRRGSGEKEMSLGRMKPELSWLFEEKSTMTPSTPVPKARTGASVAQVTRLKKSLEKLASKTELQHLVSRMTKLERDASIQKPATTPTAAPEKPSFASLRWRRIGTGVKDDRFSGPRDDGWVFRDQREAKYKPIVADLIERLLLEDGPIQIYIGVQLFKVELTGQEFGFIQRRPITEVDG